MNPLRSVWLIALVGTSAFSQSNVYIREGGSGDGSAWNNALDDLPSTLTRGNTYYIADGAYSGYTFDDTASGTSVITIKKATTSDHGTETGWVSTYGDGQATFGTLNFNTDYYEVNGVTRNESDWTAQASYGFYTPNVTIISDVNNITMRYVAVNPPGDIASGACISAVDQTGGFKSEMLFHRMLLTDAQFAFHSREMQNVTVEYTYMGPTFSKECITHQYGDNWVIRWNYMMDTGQGTGGDTQTAAIGVFNFSGGGSPADTDADNWEIYGNVFGCTGATTQANMTAQDALILGDYGNNWKFYHNTISRPSGSWGGYLKITGTGFDVKNNLWYWMGDYDATYGSILGAPTGTSHSWYYYKNAKPARLGYDGSGSELPGTKYAGSEDPFVDEANLNYLIKSSFSGTDPKDKATALGAPYNVDMFGTTHDNIGAFATTGEAGDSEPPIVSSASIATNGTSITVNFDENVTTGAGGNGGWSATGSTRGAQTMTYSSGTGTTALVFTVPLAFYSIETVTLGYTQPTNGWEDSSGNDLATIVTQATTNNSTELYPTVVRSPSRAARTGALPFLP